jgi:hypothetical protein
MSCLVGVQLESEALEALTQVGTEPSHVDLMLESQRKVVRVPHDDHVAARLARSPLLNPQVEHVVKVDVCEERRNRRPLRRPFIGVRPNPIFEDACGQPFLDEPHDPLVPDTAH